jgi:hypothetical protein
MLWPVMPFVGRIRIQPFTVALLVLTVTALACLSAFGPAMADSMGQNCPGPACEDQIGCGQAAPPPVVSGPSTLLVALSAAVGRALVLARTEMRSTGPPPLRAVEPSFAPVAPRSPPTA